jgi:hypothetical protein
MAWAPDYATTGDLEDFMRVPDADDAAVEARAITAASRAVDKATNRQFGKVSAAEDRFYEAQWDRALCRWFVEVDDFMGNASDMTVFADYDGSATYATQVTGFRLLDLNAAQKGKPWTRVLFPPSALFSTSVELVPYWIRDTAVSSRSVKVNTAAWGWSAVPVPIVEATLLQASRLVQRRNSPFGVAGSPEVGSELRLLARVDPDVDVVVRPYWRPWGAR